MKIKYLILIGFLIALFSCDKGESYENGIYIKGGEKENPSIFATIDELPMKLPIHIAIANIQKENVTAEMSADENLVESYNKKYKKNYKMLPASAYKLEHTTLTIEGDKYASEEPLLLSITSRDELEDGITYLLPVKIAQIKEGSLPVLSSSGTIYVVLNQIIITPAVDLTNRGQLKVDFSNPSKYPTTAMTKLTYEARIKVSKFKKNLWCNTVMGLEEYFCFRFVQDDFMGQLQIAGGGYVLTGKKQVPEDTWTHVACVWNGETTSIYINGELDSSLPTPNRAPIDLNVAYGGRGFIIAQSAGDSRYLNGHMSEVRVWATARTASELRNSMCWVDPSTEGLVGYWRFNNEEETSAVSDLSGNGYNAMSLSGTLKYEQGVRCPE